MTTQARKYLAVMGAAVFSAVMTVASVCDAAEPFTLTSPAFKDGAAMPKNASAPNTPERVCGGGTEVSPGFAWANPPAGTKSFAILMFDPEGQRGFGVSHWVAYDIPATTHELKEGEGSKATTAFVQGMANRDTPKFRGVCPAPGDLPHHYVTTLMALDIPPGQLKPGLTREAFFEAVKGKSLGAISIVGLFSN
jgi:Raf kinase inhibitor-like YbhB/YbcL family protein